MLRHAASYEQQTDYWWHDTSHECISNLTDTAPIAFVNECWVTDRESGTTQTLLVRFERFLASTAGLIHTHLGSIEKATERAT